MKEKHVQSWYALKYDFVFIELTAYGRPDFVFEGTKNTHVVDFGMVPLRAGGRTVDTATTEKTTQVGGYVVAPKNGKSICRWVALFSKGKGELVSVKEV